MRTLIAVLILAGFALAASPVLDTNVYKLSATKDGELSVYCANGADATVRPDAHFGHITVSCGK